MSELSFTDKRGTEWDLTITLASAKVIDSVSYENLTDVKFSFISPDKEFFQEIFVNKALAGAIAFSIISVDQLDKLGESKSREIAELEFLSRLDGKTVRKMHTALMNAIADFFPEMETVLRNLIQKMEKVNNRLQKEMTSMAEISEAQFDQEIEKAIEKTKKEMKEQFGKLHGESSTPLSVK